MAVPARSYIPRQCDHRRGVRGAGEARRSHNHLGMGRDAVLAQKVGHLPRAGHWVRAAATTSAVAAAVCAVALATAGAAASPAPTEAATAAAAVVACTAAAAVAATRVAAAAAAAAAPTGIA